MKEHLNEKVIVVTVTYNSSHFLERQLKAISQSSYPVERVVVVDNKSDENHKSKIEVLVDMYDNITVLRQEENLGGAGGFEKGVEYIVKNYQSCNWVWMMDDDAFPQEDCLEKLLSHAELKNVGCLAPMIFGVEKQEFQYYHPKNASRFLNTNRTVTTNINTQNKILSIEIDAFVGPLIKMSVIKEIGLPDGNLFIYGDDREYTYRLTRVSNMYLIRDAIINHRDEVNIDGMINVRGLWKNYYQYRNSFLFIEKYKKNSFTGFIGGLLLVKDAVRATLSTCKHEHYNGCRILRIKCIWHGIKDGICGNEGKTLDPVLFIEKYSL